MTNVQLSPSEEARRTRRILSYGIVAILATIGVAIGLSVYLRAAQPGPWNGYPFFFGFGWIWIVFAFFFLFWVVRWFFWPWRPYPYRRWGGWGDEDPVLILKERYARGELSKAEFERMMQDLRETAARKGRN